MECINELIAELSWDNSLEVQEEAIEKLLKIDEEYVTMLLQPYDKKYWENSAKVLKALDYPQNSRAIPGMFRWLRDMNWPGAWIIMEVLQNIDKKIILPYLEDAIIIAKKEDDDMWIMALRELALNRLRVKSSELKNPEIIRILVCNI